MSKRRMAWKFMCQFGKSMFSPKQIMDAVEMNNSQVRQFIKELVSENRILLVEKRTSVLTSQYQLIDTNPLPDKRKTSKRPIVMQRLWNASRVLKRFNHHDLRSIAVAGEQVTNRYLRAMKRARLIREIKTPDGVMYRLNIDLGNKHPLITDDGIRCQNRERFFPYEENL
ncbi:hypothetical protein [Photobacterium sp.]|uniref:hypothetical protein n=1 Tax=Photobacterium sp. TaxID=660 RepID=UPI00299E902F|nr:hypothetical protein [Photobacterium sp.]MDX1301220.1 hypothetical protein [Photobacterium sp.]